MPKIIDGSAMIQRVRELYEKGKVDLPYYNIVKEAVQMEPALKAQEPKYPIRKQSKHGWFFYCPKCEIILNDMARPKYCSECGQSVKWE